METSICKIIPEKKYEGNIRVLHFVYETNHNRFKQPLRSSVYRLYIVTNGTAQLKTPDGEFSLVAGSLFLIFPGCFHEIYGNNSFRYAYISFSGECVRQILQDLAIQKNSPVYDPFDGLLDFWLTSISKVNPVNANVLTESVLLYTLSLINTRNILVPPVPDDNRLYHMLIDYIDNNYTLSDLSLSKISSVFSYSEKYLSHIFKKNNTVGFSAYVQNLRINYAIELLKSKHHSVAGVAGICGYNDPLYFSKVFKKKTGLSPKEYIKTINEDSNNKE